MGEAESDPETPRISPFKFINRPNLRGEAAEQALENVEELLEKAYGNSGNENVQVVQVDTYPNNSLL